MGRTSRHFAYGKFYKYRPTRELTHTELVALVNMLMRISSKYHEGLVHDLPESLQEMFEFDEEV
ncbi:MAG: hypothetical protein ROR55_07745 [Devosia sp.]